MSSVFSTEQEQEELNLIASQYKFRCPRSISDEYRRLALINPTQMKKLIQNQFYNAAFMNTLSSLINSIFYSNCSNLPYNVRIRKWFTRLKLLSTGGYGYALEADFSNENNLFVIKVSRHKEQRDLTHELFVGLFGTNQLRKYVPNFAYIFGGFQCSPPLLSRNKTEGVLTWCTSTNSAVNYIVYENITPAVSFKELMNTNFNFPVFLNYYMQLLLALRKAYEICDFTHYDLHMSNVLLRTINKPNFYIPYETKNSKVYLLTDRIATIIDYGFSHIKYNNKHFGNKKNVASPLCDVYQFLYGNIFSRLRSNQSRTYLEPRWKKLLAFFYSDPETVLNNIITSHTEGGKRFIPLTQEDLNKLGTLDDYIEHIIRAFPSECEIFLHDIPQERIKIIGCENEYCPRPKKLIDQMETKMTRDISILELYNNVSDLTKRKKYKQARKLLKTSFNLNSINKEYRKINQNHNDIMEILRRNETLVYVTSNELSKDNLNVYFDLIQKYSNDLFIIYDKLWYNYNILKAIEYLEQWYNLIDKPLKLLKMQYLRLKYIFENLIAKHHHEIETINPRVKELFQNISEQGKLIALKNYWNKIYQDRVNFTYMKLDNSRFILTR